MKYRKTLLFIFLTILVSSFVLIDKSILKQNKAIQSSPKEKISVKEAAVVLKVVDGDTIKVLINGKEDTVRLTGIDSPEIVDERKPVQCFGKEASDKAREMLIGKRVTLESDSTQGDRDEYGRLLRYVFLDGFNFNKLMIAEGYAREYTYKGKKYLYQSEFIRAEKKAEDYGNGLWSEAAGCAS